MVRKFYAVVSDPGPNSHVTRFVKRFPALADADQFAKEKRAKLFEFNDKPLENGEDPEIRGKLIKDYTN